MRARETYSLVVDRQRPVECWTDGVATAKIAPVEFPDLRKKIEHTTCRRLMASCV